MRRYCPQLTLIIMDSESFHEFTDSNFPKHANDSHLWTPEYVRTYSMCAYIVTLDTLQSQQTSTFGGSPF